MADLEKMITKTNSWISQGATVLVSYFKKSNERVKEKELHFCGFHKGEITGNNIDVKSYTNPDILMDFIEAEKIKVSPEQAATIIENDKKNKKVNLTKKQVSRIENYANISSIPL